MVNTGSWGQGGPGGIDVGDADVFPSDGPATAQAQIAHELYENKLQYDELKNNRENFHPIKSYLPAHEKAIKNAENPVNGSQRIDTDLSSSNYEVVAGKTTGNIDQLYIKDGIKYNVSIIYVNGNVTKVDINPLNNSKSDK